MMTPSEHPAPLTAAPAEKIRVAAVVGPTASGKTALAIEIARHFHGEIVSCDSMQIYRGMDIGTAKPSPEELAAVPHHMIDIADPDETRTLADFVQEARQAIAGIAGRGCLPVLCGGTGLYADSVLKGNVLGDAGESPALRADLMRKSPGELYDDLLRVDPEAAQATHKNNVKRVVRALEIYYATGVTKTEWDRRSRRESDYDAVILGLDCRDREILYRRIDARVDQMMAAGLMEEVRSLRGRLSATASQAIGYKEIFACLDGEITQAEAADRIKLATRHYAKRQLTWFRRNPDIHWIYIDEAETFKEIVNNAFSVLT